MRLGDFSCEPGDTLILKEFDPDSQLYAGRELKKTITYVMRTDDQLPWNDEEIAGIDASQPNAAQRGADQDTLRELINAEIEQNLG